MDGTLTFNSIKKRMAEAQSSYEYSVIEGVVEAHIEKVRLSSSVAHSASSDQDQGLKNETCPNQD